MSWVGCLQVRLQLRGVILAAVSMVALSPSLAYAAGDSAAGRHHTQRRGRADARPPARCSARHGHAPSRDAVEALAEEWLEGMLPGTEHAVSPHRSQFYRELIGDWRDDPVTDPALALLPEWVRWNGEQASVPAHLIERAVLAALA